MTIVDRITEMSTRARADGRLVSILDARMITACIPDEITEDYIYLSDGWEIGKTGKLGGPPVEAEKIAKGGKLIRMESIISVDFIQKPK